MYGLPSQLFQNMQLIAEPSSNMPKANTIKQHSVFSEQSNKKLPSIEGTE